MVFARLPSISDTQPLPACAREAPSARKMQLLVGWRLLPVGWRLLLVGWRPLLLDAIALGWGPLLVGWRPLPSGWRLLLLGWRPFYQGGDHR